MARIVYVVDGTPPGSNNYVDIAYVIKYEEVTAGVLGITSSAVSGSGTRNVISINTNLVADDSSVTTSPERQLPGTGTVVCAGTVVTGVAKRTVTSSISLVSTNSTVSGTGERIIIATGTGDLVSGNSVLGDATRKVVTSAGLIAVNSSTSGIAERTIVATSTSLVSANSSVSSTLERELTSTGSLVTTGSAVSGVCRTRNYYIYFSQCF